MRRARLFWRSVLRLRKELGLVILTACGIYLLNSGVVSWAKFIDTSGSRPGGNQEESIPIFTDSLTDLKSVSGEPLIADARPILLRRYLETWKSPLAPYADLIISASDVNGVDPYLVVAIAQKETGLGRAVPVDCFNAWGWAQTERYTRCFVSWEDGIRKFTQEFADHYIKRGLVTPEEIMTRYNPSSPNGSWAIGVSHYLEDLQNFSS